MSVQPDNHTLSVYETKPIEDTETINLPVVKKYIDLVADSVRMLDNLKA